MQKRIFMLLIISFFSCLCFSQTSQTLRTDRPGIGIGSSVTGENVFQVQSGLTYDQARGTQSFEQYTFDNFMRYGLSESFEMNALVNYSQIELANSDLGGISSTQLGLRLNLRDKPQSRITSVGVQFSLKMPWESRDFDSDDISAVITLALDQDLGRGFGLSYNIGMTENQATDKLTGFYALGLSTSLDSEWGTFIELYGSLDDGDHDLFADTGLSYLYSRNLQFDFSFGGGRNENVSSYFLSAGVSWRVLP